MHVDICFSSALPWCIRTKGSGALLFFLGCMQRVQKLRYHHRGGNEAGPSGATELAAVSGIGSDICRVQPCRLNGARVVGFGATCARVRHHVLVVAWQPAFDTFFSPVSAKQGMPTTGRLRERSPTTRPAGVGLGRDKLQMMRAHASAVSSIFPFMEITQKWPLSA